MYKVNLVVVVSAQDSATALQLVQDRIEPKDKQCASNGMYYRGRKQDRESR